MNQNVKNIDVILKKAVLLMLWQVGQLVHFSIHHEEKQHRILGALVALYEEAEKPNNPTDFVRRFMGASGPDSAEVEAIKTELQSARERFDELTHENEILKERLQKYENV